MANDPQSPPASVRNTLGGRYEQAFPRLSEVDIGRLRRFGTLRHDADGALIFAAGQAHPGMLVVLKGHVALTARDGMGHVEPVADLGPGQFLGELAALTHHGTALVDARAEGDLETLMIPADIFREVVLAEAELGERIMRALILRRVGLIGQQAGGPVLLGAPSDAGVVRLQGFLTRNGHPYHVIDPSTDPAAAELIARYHPTRAELPLTICPDGSILRNPSEHELARALGMIADLDRLPHYDVAVVGAGPAGLATAVYAASEGLSIVVMDASAYGGQAGASARIENYLGFPTGISGQALTGRAYVQARKFGAEILIPVVVKGMECLPAEDRFELIVNDGQRVHARAVVVASGACYRRPQIANLNTFEGRGVWYWASPIEGALCSGQELMLVGGGNSAGQAAVYLANLAKGVRMMIRGQGLAATMSQYLIDRIKCTENIELVTEAELVALEGSPEHGLERVIWRDKRSNAESVESIRNLFLFVGADPSTAWLADCGVELDRNGFVITGGGASPLESSVPGVYAVGDVRSGSVKRVGAAIGEGAQVVAALHGYLTRAR